MYCFSILRKLFRIFGPFNFAEKIDNFWYVIYKKCETLMSSACAEDTFQSAVLLVIQLPVKKKI